MLIEAQNELAWLDDNFSNSPEKATDVKETDRGLDLTTNEPLFDVNEKETLTEAVSEDG